MPASTAKAPEIDRQLGSEYAKENVSEKLARSVFMYSFSGGQQRGATLPQLRLAVLNPEMAPPFISDALDRMTKRLWYLYHDSGLYRFDSRPNLNRILVDREETDPLGTGQGAGLRQDHAERPDRRCRLPRLPLPRSRRRQLRGRRTTAEPGRPRSESDGAEDGLPKETEEFVTRILKQHGKGFRKHANMLIFLAPDQQRVREVIDAARRLLALRSIDEDKTTKKQLSEEQLKDLADRLKEAEARLPGGPDDGLPAHPRARREEDDPLH